MRLIDADKLLEKVYTIENGGIYGDCEVVDRQDIENAQTVDFTFEETFQKTICENRLYCPARPTGEWIPVTTRDMTREDAKELLVDLSDLEYFYDNPESYWLYNCPLPDDGQEVLVSTKWGVKITTFYSDVDYGNYFEEYEDRYDVDAWMPLPEQYKKGAEE